jgi:hypothetical protein
MYLTRFLLLGQVHSMLMILVNFGTISKAQALQKEYLALELELTSKLDQVYEFSPRLQAELKEVTIFEFRYIN